MFCVKCGNELSNGVKFCRYCGHPVTTIDVEPQIEVSTTIEDQDLDSASSTPNKKLYAVLGGVLLVILIIIVVILVVFMNQSSNIKKDDLIVEPNGYGVEKKTEEQKAVSAQMNEQEVNEADEQSVDEREKSEEEILTLSPNTKEGRLQTEILKMNSSSYQEQMIDVYEIKRESGQRDTSYSWKRTVFYKLEGLEKSKENEDYIDKNLCTLVKKKLINKATGNIMDYEIYINPYNSVANKIVSIEYLENGIEVTEYYYNKSKKPEFIFQYQTDNYISTYATPNKEGQRFLFHKDCLVTWRNVSDNVTKNIAIGKKEYKRLGQSWGKDTLYEYGKQNADTKAEFDAVEKRMLNAAYNTYETVMDAEGLALIQGYVYDKDASGLSNVRVELYDADFKNVLFRTATDSDGAYRIYVPFEEYAYNVSVATDGYDSCNIYCVEVNNEQIGVYQDSIYLFEAGGTDTNISIALGDAFHYDSSGTEMLGLSGATVTIRKGINNRTGSEVVFNGTADSSGNIKVVLKPGVYTLEVITPGYETMYYTIIANPMLDNRYEFYAAPELSEGEYAVVLTWGENPRDLDSHLFTTREGEGSHVWYGGLEDDFGNSLDVDVQESYGPETVKINSLLSTDYYKFCVVDFTDCSNDDLSSYAMSYSQATVNVYSSDGWFRTFHVPTNTPGVIWEVFEIRNGKLTPIQRYYDNVTNKDWWHEDK